MKKLNESAIMKTTTKNEMPFDFTQGREGVMKGFFRAAMGLLAIAVCSSGLLAASKGTSGGQFLRIGAGARGPAMAGAVSPITDDATAIYYNPAGLARMERSEVQVSYNAYFKDTSSQFLGFAHPMENHGTVGVGLSMFGVKDIGKRSVTGGDADTPDLGTFNTRDMAAALAWANKLSLGSGRLHYGASLKFISSNLGTESAATGAIDMGAMWDLREDGPLTFSLAILNLGGELKFVSEGDPLPLNIKPGMAYRMNFERFGKLTMALDADMLVHDGLVMVQPALEWSPREIFTLRTGYQFGRDTGAGSGFAAGAGFRFMNIAIDYAFVPFGDLGDTHRVSLGYRFGGSSSSAPAQKAERTQDGKRMQLGYNR